MGGCSSTSTEGLIDPKGLLEIEVLYATFQQASAEFKDKKCKAILSLAGLKNETILEIGKTPSDVKKCKWLIDCNKPIIEHKLYINVTEKQKDKPINVVGSGVLELDLGTLKRFINVQQKCDLTLNSKSIGSIYLRISFIEKIILGTLIFQVVNLSLWRMPDTLFHMPCRARLTFGDYVAQTQISKQTPPQWYETFKIPIVDLLTIATIELFDVGKANQADGKSYYDEYTQLAKMKVPISKLVGDDQGWFHQCPFDDTIGGRIKFLTLFMKGELTQIVGEEKQAKLKKYEKKVIEDEKANRLHHGDTVIMESIKIPKNI